MTDVLLRMRRDARAVEWGGLENRCARKRTEGSNPSPSATLICPLKERMNVVKVRFETEQEGSTSNHSSNRSLRLPELF